MYVAMETHHLVINSVLALGSTTWYKLVKSMCDELPFSHFSVPNSTLAENKQCILQTIVMATNSLQPPVVLA